MPMNVDGLDQLIGDINRMASALDTANEGAPAAKRILQAAAPMTRKTLRSKR